MVHLHIQRNLRSLLFVVVALLVLALPAGVWWVNHTGLPDSWRKTIESQLARDGMFARIGALRYAPLQGIVATDVVFFSDDSLEDEVSRVRQAVVGFDKTKLARGKLEVTRLRLNDATFEMEVSDGGGSREVLEVERLNGTLRIAEGRRFEIEQMTGWVEGIEVEISARVVGKERVGSGARAATKAEQRRLFLAKVLHEIAKWNFEDEAPPRLRIWMEGDLSKPSSIRSRGVLEMGRIERNGVGLSDVVIEGEVRDSVVTVTSLSARDGFGTFDGRVDYDLEEKFGRFECGSSLDLLSVLDAWFGVKRPGQILVGGSRQLQAEGTMRVTDSGAFSITTSGKVACGSVLAKGVLFDEVESRFSWKDGSLYLRDLLVTRGDGTASGKVMVEWPMVRLALESNIPAAVYRPLFVGQPLDRIIGDFTAREGAKCQVEIEGGFDASNPKVWSYTGSAALKKTDYRGVPLTHVSCDLSVNRDELDFTNGVIGFDYSQYPTRLRYDGPRSGEASVERVRFRREEMLVDVENVKGEFWAPPMVRLFAKKTADLIEAYRFHQPPVLNGSGVVDVTPQGRTEMVVDFQSQGSATTELLGKDVVLAKSQGRVVIKGQEVDVTGLTTRVFDGPVQAEIHSGKGGKLAVDASWTKVSLPAIADTYDFTFEAGGKLTGRMDFEITRGEVGTMNGKGLVGLEDSELFSVPMFGPLSVVIGGVLQDKKAGFETADSAFCNFTIRDGIMATGDFSTSTRSLVFVGDGKVDLSEQTMDMTMRMNAQGLLGLLTIPLRPFYGMFQFRGTGPVRKPVWENVMFTAPPKDQVEALNAPPRARVVKP